MFVFFFFNDTATTEIYTLSLHDALPIYLAEQQGGERRLVRGLQDDRAPGRERRGHLPRGEVQREVPRHDRTHHAHRLAQGVGEEVAAYGERVARELVGPAGVVAERFDSHRDVDLRLEQRLAVVLRFDFGDFRGALLQELRDAIQQLAALARRQLAPLLRVEAGARRPHGGVDLRLARLRNLGERLLGRRIGEAGGLEVGRAHGSTPVP